MSIQSQLQQAKESGDFKGIIQAVPYARFIGMELIKMGDELVFLLPPSEDNVGNPTLPAIHGGVIGGFLENSAMIHVLLNVESSRMPKVVDFSLDYIRPGRYQDTYAACEVVRQGKKVVNVTVSAWQRTRDEPIANARTHLLL